MLGLACLLILWAAIQYSQADLKQGIEKNCLVRDLNSSFQKGISGLKFDLNSLTTKLENTNLLNQEGLQCLKVQQLCQTTATQVGDLNGVKGTYYSKDCFMPDAWVK